MRPANLAEAPGALSPGTESSSEKKGSPGMLRNGPPQNPAESRFSFESVSSRARVAAGSAAVAAAGGGATAAAAVEPAAEGGPVAAGGAAGATGAGGAAP